MKGMRNSHQYRNTSDFDAINKFEKHLTTKAGINMTSVKIRIGYKNAHKYPNPNYLRTTWIRLLGLPATQSQLVAFMNAVILFGQKNNKHSTSIVKKHTFKDAFA